MDTKQLQKGVGGRRKAGMKAAEGMKTQVGAAVQGRLQIGQRIRELRRARNVTLQELGRATGLSTSMISAVERDQANPSIGTLIAIADALHVSVVTLVELQDRAEQSPVTHPEDQVILTMPGGFERRLLIQDRTRGIEMALNEYAPGAASNVTPSHHGGVEFGVVLEGELEIYLNGRTYAMRQGDAVAYPSTEPHRSVNPGPGTSRTVWVNLYKAPAGAFDRPSDV